MYKLGELGKVSFRILKLDELGEVKFQPCSILYLFLDKLQSLICMHFVVSFLDSFLDFRGAIFVVDSKVVFIFIHRNRLSFPDVFLFRTEQFGSI